MEQHRAAVLGALVFVVVLAYSDAAVVELSQDFCPSLCLQDQILAQEICQCVGSIPRPVCPPLWCPLQERLPCSVYKKDSKGCPTCQCQCYSLLPRCPRNCRYGVEYKTDSNGCRVCSCKRKPVCPYVRCLNYCPNGYLKDKNGCDTCTCKPPVCPPLCKNICLYGRVLDSNGCPTCRCKPRPTPIVSLPECALFCVNGNVLDERGCPTCRCRPGRGPRLELKIP